MSLRCLDSRTCGCARSMQLSVSLIHGAHFESIQNSNVKASNKHLELAPFSSTVEQRLYRVKKMP